MANRELKTSDRPTHTHTRWTLPCAREYPYPPGPTGSTGQLSRQTRIHLHQVVSHVCLYHVAGQPKDSRDDAHVPRIAGCEALGALRDTLHQVLPIVGTHTQKKKSSGHSMWERERERREHNPRASGVLLRYNLECILSFGLKKFLP